MVKIVLEEDFFFFPLFFLRGEGGLLGVRMGIRRWWGVGGGGGSRREGEEGSKRRGSLKDKPGTVSDARNCLLLQL